MYKKWGKRAIDIVLGLIFTVILLPLGLLVWLTAVMDAGWPGIFRQPRFGLAGKEFGLLKFKTLQGKVLNNVPWTDLRNQLATPVGNFLRNHCLDEIPQIINVLLGQMSLVGPRPWQEKNFILSRLTDDLQKKRNSVKPGLTGLGQTCLRKAENRNLPLVMEYDLVYLQNICLPCDLYIILRTIKVMYHGH